MDSQSVKTTEAGGPRAYDAGKKIKGRKRHIVTDTLGDLLEGLVHGADVQEREGARGLIERHATRIPPLLGCSPMVAMPSRSQKRQSRTLIS